MPVAHSNAFAGASGDGFTAARAAGAAVDAKHTSPAFYFPSSLQRRTIELPAHPARPRQAGADRGEQGRPALRQRSRTAITTSSRRCCAPMRPRPAIPAWLICDRSFIRDYGIGLVHPRRGPAADRALHRRRLSQTRRHADGACAAASASTARTCCHRRSEHNRYAETGIDEAFGKGGTEYNQFNGDPANKPNPCLRPIAEPPLLRGRGLSLDHGHHASGLRPTATRACSTRAARRSAGSTRSATTWPRCFAASMWARASRSAPRWCSPIGR